MNERRLLTADELAAYLSLPKGTIYAWVSMRKIPGVVKLGRVLRFEKEAVDRWIDSAKA